MQRRRIIYQIQSINGQVLLMGNGDLGLGKLLPPLSDVSYDKGRAGHPRVPVHVRNEAVPGLDTRILKVVGHVRNNPSGASQPVEIPHQMLPVVVIHSSPDAGNHALGQRAGGVPIPGRGNTTSKITALKSSTLT